MALFGFHFFSQVAEPRVFLQQDTNTANNSGANAQADHRFHTDGGFDERDNLGSWGSVFTWMLTGAVADYDFRATVTAGSFTSGSQAWINGATGAIWTKTDTISGGGFDTVTYTLEIRDASSLIVLATQTGMQLRANRQDV